MAPIYTPTNKNEFSEYMRIHGFSPFQIAFEDTYRKIVNLYGKSFSIVVFSSVANGNSRDVGQDAIRVVLFLNEQDGMVKIAGSKRVNRTQNWKKSLLNRIGRWSEDLRICPQCNSVLVERKNKTNNQIFYGCKSYPKCRYTEGARP